MNINRGLLYRANELVFVRPYKLDGKMCEVGDTIKRDDDGKFPLKLNFIRYLFRRRILEPAGSNFAKFALWKHEKNNAPKNDDSSEKSVDDENQEETLLTETETETETEKTRRDELLEIAEMEGLKVDGRWSDDRLEDEINALSESDNGQS